MFPGFIQDNPGNGGGGGSGTPPSLLVGRTLFVSTVGNNATAARQDLKFHFETLEAALSASQDRDLIVIYPGDHTIDGPLSRVDYLTIFAHPGVSIQGPLFDGFKEAFQLCGYANLFCTGDQNISWQDGVRETTFIQCNSITQSGGQWLHIFGGKSVWDIKYDITFDDTNESGLILQNNNDVVHELKMSFRKFIFQFDNSGNYGIRITDLKAGSDVIFNGDIISTGNSVPATFSFDNNTKPGYLMDYSITVNGAIINNGTSGGGFALRCYNSFNDYNSKNIFRLNGSVQTLFGSYCIKVIAGEIFIKGDIYTGNKNAPIILDNDEGGEIEIGARIWHQDGNIFNTGEGVVIYYNQADAGNCYIFDNVRAKGNFVALVTSTDVNNIYAVLTGCITFAGVAPSLNFVNVVSATTLIVDPFLA